MVAAAWFGSLDQSPENELSDYFGIFHSKVQVIQSDLFIP